MQLPRRQGIHNTRKAANRENIGYHAPRSHTEQRLSSAEATSEFKISQDIQSHYCIENEKEGQNNSLRKNTPSAGVYVSAKLSPACSHELSFLLFSLGSHELAVELNRKRFGSSIDRIGTMMIIHLLITFKYY